MSPDRWCGVVILAGLGLWLLWDIRDQHKIDVRVVHRLTADLRRDDFTHHCQTTPGMADFDAWRREMEHR